MKFSIDVLDTEVGQLLHDLTQITSIETWKRRLEWLRRETTENPYMKEWLSERCSIEIAFSEALRQPLALQRPFIVDSMAAYELIAFAAGTVRCYERLSERGKRRLRGVLLDGLKEDKGLSSVQHEVTTAIHLMSRGFDVEFHDLEHGGGFDFLARKDGAEIEVECKMFSADLGRKFHKRRSAALCKALQDVLVQTYRSTANGMIVTVTIPDRLTPSSKQHRGIEQTLQAGLLSGEAITQSEYCEIQVLDFSIEESPFNRGPDDLSRSEIQRFVWARTGNSNSTLITLFSPGKRAVVLSLQSQKSDDVLKGMRYQLREAAKGQFTKTRPAFLSVQLQDLTAEQLSDLAQSDSSWRGNATGLQIMTSDFLQSPSRAHIHSVVYRSHNTLNSDSYNGIKRGGGLAYVIKNGYHPMCKDPQYSIFGS